MKAARNPTSTDLKIYEWMKAGNTLNGVVALKMFKKTGYRDCVYRLRLAGYDVQSETVRYKRNGKMKCFVKYTVKQAA